MYYFYKHGYHSWENKLRCHLRSLCNPVISQNKGQSLLGYLLNLLEVAVWRSLRKNGVEHPFYFPFQFYVSRLDTSTVLKDLKPETDYVVNVYSVVEDEYSEPLKGTEKTRKSDMRQQEGQDSSIISFPRQTGEGTCKTSASL